MVETIINTTPSGAELRPAATMIVIRDGERGLEVLLMQRNHQASFLPGFWVFPGGAVEPEDKNASLQSTLLNAAVRETCEEAGLTIDKKRLLPVSRWITPDTVAKRFDTFFYIAPVSSDEVMIDGEEVIDALWISPEDAVKRHQLVEMAMMPPTLVSFIGLIPFKSVTDVMQHYQEKQPMTYSPRLVKTKDAVVIMYPGDAGYESGDPSVRGEQHRCLFREGCWHYFQKVS